MLTMKNFQAARLKRKLCVFLTVAMMSVGLGVASASVAGAQVSNPWFVDRFPVADGYGDDARILEVRPNGRVSFEIPIQHFYGLPFHDYGVVTGGDLLDFCTGDVPEQELITYREDEQFVSRTGPGGIELPTYVYDKQGLDVLSFMIGACEASFTSGEPLPQPIASGFATLRERSNPDIPMWAQVGQPTGFHRNGVTGIVADADGNQFDLSTFVSFPLTGQEQGPPDFVRHEVSLTPVG